MRALGAIVLFYLKVLRTLFTSNNNSNAICHQAITITKRSFLTVVSAGVFVGAILVIQFYSILSKYDAQVLLGGLNTSTVVREVGPLMISFLLAGKVGAYITAELASMRVTEQIDAVECLGINSIQYLIIPRLFGITIASVILLLFGLLVSVGGSMLIGSWICGVNYLQFSSTIPRFTSLSAVTIGMLKSLLFGSIVAAVSCYFGFQASGGAKGVGKAVTASAVYTNLYILVCKLFCQSFSTRVGRHLKTRWEEIFKATADISWGSLPIIALSTAVAGIVVTHQIAWHMNEALHTVSMIPGVAGQFILRELGVAIPALLLVAKVGASITAEVGIMKNTEQLDALRLLGIRPFDYLIFPKFIGSLISGACLTLIASAITLFCAAWITVTHYHFSALEFISMLRHFIEFKDILCALVKGTIYGGLIPLVACYYGMKCKGGAEGVGTATTQSVVTLTLMIVILDFGLTYLFSLVL